MSNIIRRGSGTYTVVRNKIINDERLSMEAIGLIVWLLSKPDHWKLHISHIGKVFAVGKDKVRRVIGELLDSGYITRHRDRDAEGLFTEINYVVYEDPLQPLADVGGHPQAGFPTMDENKGNHPQAGFPRADNPPLVNTERELILIPIHTRARKSETDTQKPEPFPSDFEPNEATQSVITAKGLSQADVADEIQSMRDWATNAGPKSKRKDWQAFARNWFRKSNPKGVHRAQNPARNKNTIASVFEEIDAAFDAKREELFGPGAGQISDFEDVEIVS